MYRYVRAFCPWKKKLRENFQQQLGSSGKVETGMSFLKSLFGKKEKASIEPMRGGPVMQTQVEQDATRERMETEMAGQRTQREEGHKENPPEKSSPTSE